MQIVINMQTINNIISCFFDRITDVYTNVKNINYIFLIKNLTDR